MLARLQAQLGKTIVRSLRTADLRTAQRRRDEMLAEVRRSFDALYPDPQPWNCPTSIIAGAKQLQAAVAIGRMTPEQAMEAFQQELLKIAEQQYPPMDIPAGPTASALQRALGIVEGAEEGKTRLLAEAKTGTERAECSAWTDAVKSLYSVTSRATLVP